MSAEPVRIGTLARAVVLPAGTYGLTARPTGFLSHPTPNEVSVEGGTPR